MKDRLLKKFEDEIQALDRELKTELPKEIKRARELGDLRENAEYHDETTIIRRCSDGCFTRGAAHSFARFGAAGGFRTSVWRVRAVRLDRD